MPPVHYKAEKSGEATEGIKDNKYVKEKKGENNWHEQMDGNSGLASKS